ncbi:acyltransferase family protein [Methylobacterium sp. Gmos1]
MQRIPEIQGLRAICIFTVLIFHTSQRWLPSGYLGVDAFFGISGFVITGLIMDQCRSGRFSLRQFYIARAARLLPSLMATIALTMVGFSLLYGFNDFRPLSQSALAATLSSSNILFWLEAGYFDESSMYKPLLHTWSLGVEEQFYLIWPLCLSLFITSRKDALRLTAVITLLGLAAALAASVANPEAVFFLTPFRLHQFGFGAVFAMLSRSKQNLLPDVLLKPLMIGSGLFLCAISLVPSQSTLSQVTLQSGASFVAAAGCWAAASFRARGYRSVLGGRVAVFFGDRSYAIYLAHWPVIIAFLTLVNEPTKFERLCMLALSVAAGLALSAAVERPSRLVGRRDPAQARKLAVSLGSTATAVILTGLALLAPQRWWLRPSEQAVDAKHVAVELNEALQTICRVPITTQIRPSDVEACFSPSEKNILVVGDSKAAAIALALTGYSGIRVTELSLEGCPPYFGADNNLLKWEFDHLQPCRTMSGKPWARTGELILKLSGLHGLVLAGNFNAQEFSASHLIENVAWLQDRHFISAVVDNMPHWVTSAIRLHDAHRIVSNDLRPFIDLQHHPDQRDRAIVVQQEGAKRGVHSLEVFDALCGTRCPAYAGDKIMYFDRHHLTAAGAAALGRSGVFDHFVDTVLTQHPDSTFKKRVDAHPDL